MLLRVFWEKTLIFSRNIFKIGSRSFSNLEMSKITAWSKRNKVGFNDEESKVMLISRRKRKEVKDINIYLNN